MKKKILTCVAMALVALGIFIGSHYVASSSTADKLSSLAGGMFFAIFVVSLASAVDYYKKNKSKAA